MDHLSPEVEGRAKSGTLLPLNEYRLKGAKLQRAYESHPWVRGFGDPSYRVWIDIPTVSEDAPDVERR